MAVSDAPQGAFPALTPSAGRAPDRGIAPSESGRVRWRGAAVAAACPFLLAIYPTLWVAQSSGGSYTLSDLPLILGVVLTCTAVGLLPCVLVIRALGRDAPVARGAWLATLAVAWMFYFVPLQRALTPLVGPLARGAVLGSVCLTLSAALAWRALRRRWTLDGVLRGLTLTGAVLVALAGARITAASLGAWRRIERSAIWRESHAPVRIVPALAHAGPRRDIYFIVLDGYPNAAVLRARFGYDDTPFLDSLRALGFTIPRRIHSNYSMTELSLASMLNGVHAVALARALTPNSTDESLPTALIRENRVARFLRAQGYRYLLYPSEWVEWTASSPLAEYTYRGPSHASPFAEIHRTELRRVTFASTLVGKVRRLQREYGGVFVLDEFRALRAVPDRREPTFTFAHFLLPHRPVVLDSACHPIERAQRIVTGPGLATAGERSQLLGAIACAHTQVLSLAHDLIRRSDPQPIIIVVGDHGTLSRGWTRQAKLPADSIAAERLGAFGAFYMPGGGDALFRDSVTHVNVFRHVLRYYFGADLPPLPGDSYLSEGTEPFRFRRVDERVILGG